MSAGTISKSKMLIYSSCRRAYYYVYIAHEPTKVDYPRLMGSEVHRFTAHLYHEHKDPNQPFFFANITKAHNAWFNSWGRALKANEGSILFPDFEKSQEHAVSGWVCIKNYWDASVNKARPLYIEKRYTVPIMKSYKFVGIFDQIRQAPLESISKYRPELVVDGQLIDGYDPVFIIDLKTNKQSYDLTVFRPEASLLEQAAHQFSLHEDLQVTAYYWLYWKVFHKLPVGFFWWHLRSGKLFYTYRTQNDFSTFLEKAESMLDGLESSSFPKDSGPYCKYCDYFEICGNSRADRPLMVTKAVDTANDAAFEPVISNKKIEKVIQLAFKFPKIPGIKKEEPVTVERVTTPNKIVTLPAES